MLAMIDRLRSIESEKQAVELGSPEFVALAIEAERLSRMAFRWAGMQLQMAEASAGAVQRGELSRVPLIDVKPRALDVILANWREAQLRFELAQPGSPEAAAAAEEVERLRVEFHATQEEKLAAQADDGVEASQRRGDDGVEHDRRPRRSGGPVDERDFSHH